MQTRPDLRTGQSHLRWSRRQALHRRRARGRLHGRHGLRARCQSGLGHWDVATFTTSTTLATALVVADAAAALVVTLAAAACGGLIIYPDVREGRG